MKNLFLAIMLLLTGLTVQAQGPRYKGAFFGDGLGVTNIPIPNLINYTIIITNYDSRTNLTFLGGALYFSNERTNAVQIIANGTTNRVEVATTGGGQDGYYIVDGTGEPTQMISGSRIYYYGQALSGGGQRQFASAGGTVRWGTDDNSIFINSSGNMFAPDGTLTGTTNGLQTTGIRYPDLAWDGATNTFVVTNNFATYVATTDCAVTNVAGGIDGESRWGTLIISNSTASTIFVWTYAPNTRIQGTLTTTQLPVLAGKESYLSFHVRGQLSTNLVTSWEQ